MSPLGYLLCRVCSRNSTHRRRLCFPPGLDFPSDERFALRGRGGDGISVSNGNPVGEVPLLFRGEFRLLDGLDLFSGSEFNVIQMSIS